MGTLNASGAISLGGATAGASVNLALGFASNAVAAMNANPIKALIGNVTPASQNLTFNYFYGKNAPTIRCLFGYGNTVVGVTGSPTAVTNICDNTGTIAADVAGVGTARNNIAGCSYGFDKGIFGFGFAAAVSGVTNLVSNLGVVAGDVAAVGTARAGLGATTYGFDKGIFGYGATTVPLTTSNLVSNTGVVATNVTSPGTARREVSAAPYGYNLGVFVYGQNQISAATYYSVSNKVSSAGVIAADTAGVGTARGTIAAAGYGYDKAIFLLGANGAGVTAISNLVSNTGVVSTDTAAVAGVTARFAAAGGTYGYAGQAMVYGGGNGTSVFRVRNLIQNTGVVGADATIAVATARQRLGCCGFSIN